MRANKWRVGGFHSITSTVRAEFNLFDSNRITIKGCTLHGEKKDDGQVRKKKRSGECESHRRATATMGRLNFGVGPLSLPPDQTRPT